MNRSFLLFAICLSAAASAQIEINIPAATFFQTTTLRGAVLSPEGTEVLLTSDESGSDNLYLVSAEGGEKKAITNAISGSMVGRAWFPREPKRWIMTADEGGNELDHIYVVNEKGSMLDLTPGEKHRAQFLHFSDDGTRFFVLTNERDAKFFDLYEYEDSATALSAKAELQYPRKLIYENKEGFDIVGLAPNGRTVILGRTKTEADSDLYALELGGKDPKPKHFTPHKGEAVHEFLAVAPDQRTIYFASDKGGDFRTLYSYDLKENRERELLREAWDVVSCSLSRTGKYRVVGLNQDARDRLQITNLSNGQDVEQPELEDGLPVRIQFADIGTKALVIAGGDQTPTDAYVWDVQTNQTVRLTKSLTEAIPSSTLVGAISTVFESYDKEKVYGLLYKPQQARRDQKVPAVIFVHGGPGGQSRAGYRPEIQALVNHGFAVFAINHRGSSGYGKRYYHLDDRRHGDADLKDCVAARQYLSGLPWIDGSKMAIMGGSYGGYMVAAALAFQPDAFDAGINIFGVTNWVRTLESIPAWWESQRHALYTELGDPAVEKERLTKISPLFSADKIKKPLLVVQGKNDPRVLQVESDELVAAVKKNGTPVEYIVFNDEGHGFKRRENRQKALEAYLAFLKEHLKGQKSAGN